MFHDGEGDECEGELALELVENTDYAAFCDKWVDEMACSMAPADLVSNWGPQNVRVFSKGVAYHLIVDKH